MILTTKSDCQDNMSEAGWALFCQHQIQLGAGDPESWPETEEVTLDKVQVGQYEYQTSSTPDIGQLWHEGKSFGALKNAAERDLDGVLYNLTEDISVLKEMLAEARTQAFMAQTASISMTNTLNQVMRSHTAVQAPTNEALIDWVIDGDQQEKLFTSSIDEVIAEYQPETEGGRENGGTNAMLIWEYPLPSGNELKIYLEEDGAFEVEHVPASHEAHGHNTIAYDENLQTAISDAIAAQHEVNVALMHFYQNCKPVTLKDGLVDVWWTVDGQEETNELYIPWEVRMQGSKTVEDFIDDTLAQYDEPGYTKTW